MVKRSESFANDMASIGSPMAPWSGLSMVPRSAPSGARSMWITSRIMPWSEPCQTPSIGASARATRGAAIGPSRAKNVRSQRDERMGAPFGGSDGRQ
jgi:hypothetical protein